MGDTRTADNTDGQQEAVTPTKSAEATWHCEAVSGGIVDQSPLSSSIVDQSPLSSSGDSGDTVALNSDSEVASSCSGEIGSPVQIGDSVVVKEGPSMGQTGTVVNDDDGSGIAIQVALSNGTVDWFARSPSHDVSCGNITDSDREVVQNEVDSASCNASELENVSDSEFEQACSDALNASHQGPISGQNQQSPCCHSPCSGGGPKHRTDFAEPPLKRTRVEVPIVEKMETDGGEAKPLCCLTSVGA